MADHVMVPIPRWLYNRAVRLARERNQDLSDLLAQALASLLVPAAPDEQALDLSEPDDDAEREMAAYLTLYPRLKEGYRGRFVAIHGGELVDYDDDYHALYARIDQRYAGKFVWLSRVEDEPLNTLYFRSPRLSPTN